MYSRGEALQINNSNNFQICSRNHFSRKEVSIYLPASILKSGVVSDMIFAVQQTNIDELTNILYDISDPDSPNYGQHWSNDEVSEFTSNPEGLDGPFELRYDTTTSSHSGLDVNSETSSLLQCCP